MLVKQQKTEEISDESSEDESPSPVKPKHLKKKKRASPPPPEALSSPAEVVGLPIASGAPGHKTVQVHLQQLVDFIK